MTKEKIISGIKKAGVIATAVVTLGACEQKRNTNDAQVALYKTDSVANARPEYKNMANAVELYEEQIQTYKDANKSMLKHYAKDHIKKIIQPGQMRKLLLAGLEEQMFLEVTCLDFDESLSESADFNPSYVRQVRFFRRNQRWYNDLVMYLLGNYNEKQLLKSDFFKVIKDQEIKKAFLYNTKQIEKLESVAKIASERQNKIYEDLWCQNSNGNQRTR